MSISSTTAEPATVGPMKDPPHPGEIIREEVIRPLGISVTAAASALGVTRQALSAFLNGRSDLSPEMALRIEVALGPKAEVMMGVQTDYAMARARVRLPEIIPTVRRVARDPDRGRGVRLLSALRHQIPPAAFTLRPRPPSLAGTLRGRLRWRC